jgi:hypothetical protein
MVTSATYCQSATVDPAAEGQAKAWAADRDDHLLWHARRQRLEGEALRDAMLALSGELNLRMFGPSARPKLPEKISNYAWKPDEKPEDQNRRSVYVLAKRNLRYPLFAAFDQPDLHNSCSRRMNTTTAPQALLLLNSDFVLERARAWSAKLLAKHGGRDGEIVTEAYRAAWGRAPTDDELRLGVGFVSAQAKRLEGQTAGKGEARERAVADFCHAVLNTNEFLYVD